MTVLLTRACSADCASVIVVVLYYPDVDIRLACCGSLGARSENRTVLKNRSDLRTERDENTAVHVSCCLLQAMPRPSMTLSVIPGSGRANFFLKSAMARLVSVRSDLKCPP